MRLLFVLLVVAAPSIAGAVTCTTGKACGDTCIAQSDTCHVGGGSANNGSSSSGGDSCGVPWYVPAAILGGLCTVSVVSLVAMATAAGTGIWLLWAQQERRKIEASTPVQTPPAWVRPKPARTVDAIEDAPPPRTRVLDQSMVDECKARTGMSSTDCIASLRRPGSTAGGPSTPGSSPPEATGITPERIQKCMMDTVMSADRCREALRRHDAAAAPALPPVAPARVAQCQERTRMSDVDCITAIRAQDEAAAPGGTP